MTSRVLWIRRQFLCEKVQGIDHMPNCSLLSLRISTMQCRYRCVQQAFTFHRGKLIFVNRFSVRVVRRISTEEKKKKTKQNNFLIYYLSQVLRCFCACFTRCACCVFIFLQLKAMFDSWFSCSASFLSNCTRTRVALCTALAHKQNRKEMLRPKHRGSGKDTETRRHRIIENWFMNYFGQRTMTNEMCMPLFYGCLEFVSSASAMRTHIGAVLCFRHYIPRFLCTALWLQLFIAARCVCVTFAIHNKSSISLLRPNLSDQNIFSVVFWVERHSRFLLLCWKKWNENRETVRRGR